MKKLIAKIKFYLGYILVWLGIIKDAVFGWSNFSGYYCKYVKEGRISDKNKITN